MNLSPSGAGCCSALRALSSPVSGGLSASEALQRDPAAGASWRAWAFSGPDSESGENRQRSTTPPTQSEVRGRYQAGKPFSALRRPRQRKGIDQPKMAPFR